MARSSIVIHNAVMSDEMQREALQCALLAVNMYQNASGIATYIAKVVPRVPCFTESIQYLHRLHAI